MNFTPQKGHFMYFFPGLCPKTHSKPTQNRWKGLAMAIAIQDVKEIHHLFFLSDFKWLVDNPNRPCMACKLYLPKYIRMVVLMEKFRYQVSFWFPWIFFRVGAMKWGSLLVGSHQQTLGDSSTILSIGVSTPNKDAPKNVCLSTGSPFSISEDFYYILPTIPRDLFWGLVSSFWNGGVFWHFCHSKFHGLPEVRINGYYRVLLLRCQKAQGLVPDVVRKDWGE